MKKARASRVDSNRRLEKKTFSRKVPLRAKIGLLLFSLFVAMAVSELGLRMFYRDVLAHVEEERSLPYQYDPRLGWFPVPNSKKLVTASRTITAAHNSEGFRGPELAKNDKPRIVFLGDSLVWGFDVEASERFTEKLQAKHPEWAVYNFGVSGYGTDQEYLLLQKYFDEYRPRVVLLIICGDNDNEDNAWNFRGGYYKPYYVRAGGGLKVEGVPVPRSEKVFAAEHKFLCHAWLVRLLARSYYRLTSPPQVKNQDPPTGALILDMRKYVVEKGAVFATGLQHSNPELQEFLVRFKIPYVDLATTNPTHCYSAFGNHWTPEGHSFVAHKIEEFLRAGQ